MSVLIHKDTQHLFMDQFAFRPTGSTTAAIICLLHRISEMLLTNPFVHLIALDFSKAFDTVCHSTMMEKFSNFPIPDNVYNWVVNFLSDRCHHTRFMAFSLRSLSFLQASCRVRF